jgi:hypothetical protein
VLADIEKGLKQISHTSEPSNDDYVTVLTLGPDPRTSIKWPINRFVRVRCKRVLVCCRASCSV